MIKEYIPIEAISHETSSPQTWYIDSANMSLEEILLLRSKLLGGVEIPCIDKIIRMRIQTPKNYHDFKMDNERYRKETKIKMKRRKKND